MLEGRKYKEQITLVNYNVVEDAFGKQKVENAESTFYTFAQVKQNNQSRVMYEGNRALQTAFVFTIRYTDFQFNKIIWNNKEYIVNSLENLNQSNKELVIYTQIVE